MCLKWPWITGAALLVFLAACATTPTGRDQLLLISEDSAIAASKPAYVQMLQPYEEKGKLDSDPELNARVGQIISRLIAQAILVRPETKDWEWSIRIIDDPKTVNAWAMAGGKMAIYTGFIEKVKPTDDELANVLGHEIAHALAKHTAEKMSVAMASQIGIMAIGMLSDKPGITMTGAALAAQLAIGLPNSRTAESEADEIGIELAAKAGYDPRAAVTLWDKMGKTSNGRPPEFLSTHPDPDNRKETLSKMVEKMLPYYEADVERPVYELKQPTQSADK